jgi:hypothetical protein
METSQIKTISTPIPKLALFEVICDWAQTSKYIVRDIWFTSYALFIIDKPRIFFGPGYTYIIFVKNADQGGSTIEVEHFLGPTKNSPRMERLLTKCFRSLKETIIKELTFSHQVPIEELEGGESIRAKLDNKTITSQIAKSASFLLSGNGEDPFRILQNILVHCPSSVEAWLWMSGAVISFEERLYCLNKVLELEPGNDIARRSIKYIPTSVTPICPISYSFSVNIANCGYERTLKHYNEPGVVCFKYLEAKWKVPTFFQKHIG